MANCKPARPKMVAKPINILGEQYGRLVPLRFAGIHDHRAYWTCLCDCGRVFETATSYMRSGNTQSCGCATLERVIERSVTHGAMRAGEFTGAYRSWRSMKARCNYPGNNRYYAYGGRGIKVCERWNDFANFLADMGERPEGHTLERKDVDGNYEPANCCWLPAHLQARNQRRQTRTT